MIHVGSIFRKNKRIVKTDLIIIGLFCIGLILYAFWQPDIISTEEVNELTQQFGAWGPVTVIVFIILEVVIAPIPGGLIPIAIGIFYGFYPGFIYVFVGNIVGSLLAFWIARSGGRRLVGILLHKKHIKRFDSFIERNRFLVWFTYFVPLLPMDTMSFVAGFSNMKLKKYLFIITTGFAFHLSLLTLFGQKLVDTSPGTRVTLGIILMVIVVVAVTINQLVIKKRLS